MVIKDKRPSWDEYFMMMANIVKNRADCLRRQVGSVIVRDFRIISTGYNGTPHKIKNCSEGGCLRCLRRDKGEIKGYEYEESCVCIHGEQNAIIQAAYHGSSTKGSTLYTTANPCSSCAKILANAGIVRVVCRKEHHDLKGIELLKKAGIKVEVK
ncbi:dCMP deaminase family protein [Candidatus Roizmanbacteria bacterium]|nr:dCMP deaminase family protein [Candidatus Roizmanbacteria bacterium]